MNKTIISVSLLFLSFGLLLTACSSSEPDLEAARSLITEEGIMRHVEALAHDSTMGRAPGSIGEQMTVDYIIREFEEIGLVGGMPDGSFVQRVPAVGQQTAPGSVMRIHNGSRTLHSFNSFTDMMAWPAAGQREVNIRDAELVYVGYGIIAPEEDWDDYKGMDMSGKILVFKNSDPSTHPDRFAGNTRLYYGRWSYKYEIAEELGALGAIIIHTLPTAGYGWNVVSGSWSRERFALADEMQEESDTELNAWIQYYAAERIFSEAGLDIDSLLDEAESPDFHPVVLEGVKLDIDLTATYSELEFQNVIGVLPGSDRRLRDEYVVFSAHHDHLGVGMAVDGDSVFNGAMDNASGTSGMIEMARAFASVQPHLRRSLMFAAVGAEESGLLGSRYLAFNSPVPVGKISANINIDMINGFGQTRDVVIVGKGRTSMDQIMIEEAEKLGRYVVPDQDPGQGFYYRSDHFSFARVGIPALFPNPGVDYIHDENFHQDVVIPHLRHIYHTVHDTVENVITFKGAEDDMRLLFNVAYRIANANEMQSWVPGDEFEAARMRALQQAGR
ncbi:MAG: M28 family peptidase [Balneolales bacterium]|nr:M28 family peptidase [Balneolales bacterium]